MSELQVHVIDNAGATVVSVTGDASVGNVNQLQVHFSKLLAQHPKLLVLDLSKLVFIASLGMGALVSLDRDIRRHGGTLRIAGLQPFVLKALQSSRLDSVFEIHTDLQSALVH